MDLPIKFGGTVARTEALGSTKTLAYQTNLYRAGLVLKARYRKVSPGKIDRFTDPIPKLSDFDENWKNKAY